MSSGTSKPTNDQTVNASTQFVLIAPEQNLEQSGNYANQPVFCKLRHPKSGAAALFMFTNDNQKILELLTFNEVCRSWFIGDTVQKDGRFYLASSLDPTFLILPYLVTAFKSGKFMQLDGILEDSDFPNSKCLTLCLLDDLESVADVKESSGTFVYRYNREKTLSWLQLKVNRVISSLKRNSVSVSSAALLATYTRSSKPSDTSEAEFVRYAAGLISDYLDQELAADLHTHLGISSEETALGGEDSDHFQPAAKKLKLEVQAPTEDYSQANSIAKKTEKKTAAQKQLSKVDKSGIKAISSFFTPKTNRK